MQREFPGLNIEGGPYTPPAAVQYGIRAARVAQVGVGVFFFFGEKILASMGRPPFEFMGEITSNVMVHAGALYGLNLIADTLKSINAFEVIYNGQVVHSKLKSGGFPEPGVLGRNLREAVKRSKPRQERCAPQPAPPRRRQPPPESASDARAAAALLRASRARERWKGRRPSAFA